MLIFNRTQFKYFYISSDVISLGRLNEIHIPVIVSQICKFLLVIFLCTSVLLSLVHDTINGEGVSGVGCSTTKCCIPKDKQHEACVAWLRYSVETVHHFTSTLQELIYAL